MLGTATASAWSRWTAAFVQRLQEFGWIEGRTVAIEYRWAEGRANRYTEIAVEFARLKVDVIVTSGGAVVAAKQATSVIPIVFATAADPVGDGLVASLARPVGNATGLSNQSADLAGKRLELLREVVPSLRTLAIMANVGYPASVLEVGEVQPLARTRASSAFARPTQNLVDIRIRLSGCDRALLVWMTRLWPSLLGMTQVVEPETILRWQHRPLIMR